jgi:starch synthase
VENPVFFSYHGRIVWQKGLDVLAETIPLVLTKNPQAYFIVIGQGQPELEDKHIALANQFPGRYVYLRGYERALSRECLAASDFLVLPSFFEPCGLEDFIGQIFASLPIAHAVGGLQKIDHGETGFLYEDNTGQGLAEALLSAMHLFNTDRELLNAMIIKASYSVKHNYTWQSIVEEYIAFYQNIVNPQSKLLT